MEHFVETEWSGFLVGSKGTIINNTGMKFVKYGQATGMYVGLEYNGKRSMKRLADLVYRYHIRGGRPLLEGTIIRFKDGNINNVDVSNLIAIDKAFWHQDLPFGGVSSKHHKGVCYEVINCRTIVS